MPLARLDLEARGELRRSRTRGIHRDSGIQSLTIGKDCAAFRQSRDTLARKYSRATPLRTFDQMARHRRRIHRAIAWHQQAPGQTSAQIRFRFSERLRIQNVGRHATRGVIVMLANHFGHFFFVGRHPKRAARQIFAIGGETGSERVPKTFGVLRQPKLSFGIVHDDDMAHAGRGCAAANHIFFHYGDAQPAFGALKRAGRAHNSSAHDEDIGALRAHHRMPQQKGSASSRIRSASALTKADPVMNGRISPFTISTRPENTEPTTLSCRHSSPSFSLPSA